MKKQMMKSALIALAGVGLMSGSGWAVTINTINNGEQSLQTIVDNAVYTGTSNNKQRVIDVNNDQSIVTDWTMAENNVDAYLISLFTAGSGNIGIASSDHSVTYTFNLGTSSTPGSSFSFWIYNNDLYTQNGSNIVLLQSGIGSNFTFYYELTSGTKYFAGSANAVNYLVEGGANIQIPLHNTTTSTGDNDWVFAFEDGTDYDFNDAVYYLEDLNAVPEPATMLLFGTGIVSLAGLARRRK